MRNVEDKMYYTKIGFDFNTDFNLCKLDQFQDKIKNKRPHIFFPKIKNNFRETRATFAIKHKKLSFFSNEENNQTPLYKQIRFRKFLDTFVGTTRHQKEKEQEDEPINEVKIKPIEKTQSKQNRQLNNLKPKPTLQLPPKITKAKSLDKNEPKQKQIKKLKPFKFPLSPTSTPSKFRYTFTYHNKMHNSEFSFNNKFIEYIKLISKAKTKSSLKNNKQLKYPIPKIEEVEKGKEMSNYTFGKEIGKGSYATVKLCYNKIDKKEYAVKIYKDILIKGNSKKESVYKEIQLLKSLQHENIIKVYEFFEENNSLYIIMEKAKGISLIEYLKSLPYQKVDELKAKRIFTQLISALAYLHSNNICHRDIKMENIMIDQSLNIKLLDFGFGIKFETNDTKLNFFCGTPSYMPPEIIKQTNYFGPAADIWSSGILLYRLLTGTFPFKGINEKDLYNKICSGTFIIPNTLSLGAHSILKKILCVNPKERITAEVILKQEWIVNLMDIFRHY